MYICYYYYHHHIHNKDYRSDFKGFYMKDYASMILKHLFSLDWVNDEASCVQLTTSTNLDDGKPKQFAPS